ncbi:related to myosin tail region-interacting protein MTI1 [Rhynchosporium agropyri]|uniref:Related to myosin tail region-interacting protein MTI1 n=1 Tax=Rhynchosporium agropyri TaxID=914238 RepID=A0A1E1LCF0_9HELO|nr:related to myosin tail region-interacting protein MTI1 [Rhynchosporium agropyri]
MPEFKEIAKGGWHPKGKDGKSKESWRGDFKGIDQISGWMGKKKGASGGDDDEHISRPLHSLKDPSAFGPPPKNVNYHGGAALPNQTTPDTGGWGATLSRDEIRAKKEAEEEEARREAEEAAKPKGPPVPYRKDTTGLSTAHLPPPPGRKDGADGRIPAPADKPKPPGLPPRLPPRQNSNSTPPPPPPYPVKTPEPDAHRGILNQGALSRLGAAGVSVPGFGISGAKSKQPLPPPSRSSTRSPVIAPSVNNSQLNELQSRFSRLSSTSTPKPEAPSQGTTFAQKQAALKTASSFRNDPSSVSISDAKTAASTANNFRERHGEQVKTGWQSANKLNTKYGITDKVGAYGAPPATAQEPETQSPQAGMRGNTNGSPLDGLGVGILGKKKPPPPPPAKRKDLMGSGVGQEPLPPPIPLSSKPKPPPSSPSRNQPVDLDLDLKSQWFVKGQFPPRTVSAKSYTTSSGWSSSGSRKSHWLVAHMRFADLSSTKIRVSWDGSSPEYTVKAEQRHTPPPPPLSRRELEECRERYSEQVAAWSESQMGSKVGNGECWTLANEALKAVATTYKAHNQEPCMASQSLVHGHILYTYIPTQSRQPVPAGGILAAGVARGDIIQILKAKFESANGGWQTAGDPDHTAVITGVDPDGTLRVVQQNVGGKKIVMKGTYDMNEMTTGEVRIFRAVGADWLGELNTDW